MELTERKLQILKYIISDFISSAEPVGSRTLSRKYDMDISAATIRNEMSDLEEMGYLTHPHTSAGRVPSDKAYRLYVDDLMSEYKLSREERKAIEEKFTQNAMELEETLGYAAGLLSELTSLISFAMTPVREENKLSHIELLPVSDGTVVLMIIAEDGKITNKVVRLDEPYSRENLELVSRIMTHTFSGKTINDILTGDIIETFKREMATFSRMTDNITMDFLDVLRQMLSVDLYMEGHMNVFSIPEFRDLEKAKGFLEIAQYKQPITDMLLSRGNGLIITIGDENSEEFMKDCSLVTADYWINGRPVGKLGVIGPTRMKYGEISSIIKHITDKVNRAFNIGEGE